MTFAPRDPNKRAYALPVRLVNAHALMVEMHLTKTAASTGHNDGLLIKS